MGNVCVKSRRRITLVMLGLDNAGKTTTTKGLIGEPPDDVTPTLGFSSYQLKRNNFDVTLYDLGGSRSIRGIWRNYLAEAYGFVFVVDASDLDRANESKEVLHDLLKSETVSGKPFLILANKQDIEGAVDDVELVGLLQVESLANETKCRTRVEICSALYGVSGKRPDLHIQSGFNWLLTTIGKDYENLKERVAQDVNVQQALELEELKQRSERVARLIEDRTKLEETVSELDTLEDKKDFINGGDPFKPISTVVKDLEDEIDAEITEIKPGIHTPVAQLIRVASADVDDCEDLTSRDKASIECEDSCPPKAEMESEALSKQAKLEEDVCNDGDDSFIPISPPSTFTSSMIGTNNQVIELEKSAKSRKRRIFGRNNKTGPSPMSIVSTSPSPSLPTSPSPTSPVIKSDSLINEVIAPRQPTPNGFVKISWSLAEELEGIESSRLPQIS